MATITIINSKRDVPRNLVLKMPNIYKYYVDGWSEARHVLRLNKEEEGLHFQGKIDTGKPMYQLLGVEKGGFYKIKSVKGKDNSNIPYKDITEGETDVYWSNRYERYNPENPDGVVRNGKMNIEGLTNDWADMYSNGKNYLSEDGNTLKYPTNNFNIIMEIEYSRDKVNWSPVTIEFDFTDAVVVNR